MEEAWEREPGQPRQPGGAEDTVDLGVRADLLRKAVNVLNVGEVVLPTTGEALEYRGTRRIAEHTDDPDAEDVGEVVNRPFYCRVELSGGALVVTAGPDDANTQQARVPLHPAVRCEMWLYSKGAPPVPVEGEQTMILTWAAVQLKDLWGIINQPIPVPDTPEELLAAGPPVVARLFQWVAGQGV